MKKKIALSAILFLFSNFSHADWNEWSNTEKNLFYASEISLLIDWKQTLDIQKNPNLQEINPILGKHPSDGYINNYFAVALVSNYLIADYFKDYRIYILSGVTAVETLTIYRNKRYGIGIGIPFN